MSKSNKIYLLSDKKVEDAINLPMLDIKYIKQSIDLEKYDALIFTSKNAVKAMDSLGAEWKNIPSYVIAPQTAKILKSQGGNLVFTGKQNHGNEFAQEIQKELKGKKVLYVRGKKIISNIEEILKNNGVLCDSVAVYETVCKKYDEKVILPKDSVIIFSSPSTIECFFGNIDWDDSFQAVSIGKTTAQYFPSHVKAHISDTTSLISCVEKARELL